MPLYGRRLFHWNEDDDKDERKEELYTIEHTGQTLHSSTLYEKLKKIYAFERWTCECTWRAGLTHEEAHQSEIDTRKSLPTMVADYFHKPIFEIIHHNVKPLEKLAEEVSIMLGQSFVIDEPVQFKKKKENNIVKGVVERIEENEDPKKRTSERASIQSKPPSDKQMKNVKYSVRLFNEDQVINNVLPSELQRCTFIPNREKLKTFIRSYAIRLGNRVDSPWIFYDSSNQQKYDIKDRISADIIAKFRKSMTTTLKEILREHERLARKQAEEQAAALEETKKSNEINNNTAIPNGHFDDIQIILSDDENLVKKLPDETKKKTQKKKEMEKEEKAKSTPSSPSKPRKSNKQLTLHDMKFTKNSPNHTELLEKSSATTYDIAIPYSLLQKLDKTRRDRGIDSKFFHRLVLHCARTLNDKQRLRLPEEYRSLIQIKYDELEMKRRLSQMSDEEKKQFLQSKRLEQKPIEDLELTFSKDLPLPKQIQSTLLSSSKSMGDLLIVCTFLTSCHSLFDLSLNDSIPKSTQGYLRSFKFDYLLNTTPMMFCNYFQEILQIFMKLLFKEDENRSNSEEEADDSGEDGDTPDEVNNNHEKKSENNTNEPVDLEELYSIQLSDIPLTPFTCQELTRLYLLKEKDETNQNILQKLATSESKDLLISEQIDLLLLLVNTITTDSELMSDYFEYLTRTMSEAARERNLLVSERRKAQEEESKRKKLQLQNGENEKVSTKKLGPLITPKNSLGGTTNDENEQTSPMIVDENGEIDNGNDDDLKSVLQRRRQMVAMSKELKEKREIETQQLHLKQKRQLAIQKAEQIYQDALLNLQHGFRIKPLGFDRNYNRYWYFRGYPGLFVEKGWIGSDVNYTVQCSSSQDISSSNHNEKSIPKDESNEWFIYEDEDQIQQVFQSLNDRGIREHNLSMNLKKALPLIHTEFEYSKKSKHISEQEELAETSNDIVNSFRSELEDIETRLRLGSLGGFTIPENLHEWQTKLKETTERLDLAELLLQLQQTVTEKYTSGIFHLSQEKKPFQMWLSDCRTCQTYSRLYVLMMIFENCITWNKSTLGMKCKICRKKHKEESLMVCDQCCYGFHQECLRRYSQTQQKTSSDLWYCPACRPVTTTKRRGKQEKKKVEEEENDIYDMDVESRSSASTNPRQLSDSNSDHDGMDEGEHACRICSGEDDLIQCTQCQLSYHCQCHEPPLRCPPRSTTWICNHCRNGISQRSKPTKQIKKSQSKNPSKPTTRRSGRKSYCEEESFEDDNSGPQRRSKRLRRSEPSPVKSNERTSRTRQRVRPTKSTSSDDEEPIAGDDEESAGEENDNEADDSPSSD